MASMTAAIDPQNRLVTSATRLAGETMTEIEIVTENEIGSETGNETETVDMTIDHTTAAMTVIETETEIGIEIGGTTTDHPTVGDLHITEMV